jgi:hypothetical protein
MMMRFTRTFMAFSLITALAIAAPAAAKPGKPKPPPEPDPEPTALICDMVTTFSGSGGLTLECDWTPAADTGATLGTVTVEAIGGTFSYLAIAVRDSAPGDYCYLANWNKPTETSYTASLDLVREGSSYWASDGNWCGAREDLNGAPLTITVSTRVKRGTQVVVTLDPPQS